MKTKERKILGVDIGDVLRKTVRDGEFGSIYRPDDSYLESSDFPGALDAIRQMLETYSFEEIHIVSVTRQANEEKLLKWLQHKGYGRYIHPGRVHFCRRRHEKARICKEMGITDFIDDRLEVLWHMKDVPNICWFRPTMNVRKEDKPFLDLIKMRSVHFAFNWKEVLERFILSPNN